MKIAFAHNVYNRLKTLRETILIEKKIFPESHVSVACNDVFVNIFQDISNFSVVSFNEKPHKIGCVNGLILSIQNILNQDFDVLIFSHDDVRINLNNVDIVKSHINDILTNKYDVICRKPIENWGDNYYLMEVIIMSKSAAIKLFSTLMPLSHESQISKDIKDSISPEVYLYELLNNKDLKINEVKYAHETLTYNNTLSNTMGFIHLNAGDRGWRD